MSFKKWLSKNSPLARKKGSSSWEPFFFSLLGCAGVLLTALSLSRSSLRPELFDPDRLYHLAVLREMNEQGALILRAWDQLWVYGWDQFFPDKEFLFHTLLAPFRHLGGEPAALFVGFVFAATTVWIPYLLLPGSRLFALFASFILLSNPNHWTRLAIFRPHNLAVPLFLLFLFCLYRRRPWLTALCAALFCLSYHAFYLLLLPLGAYALCAFALCAFALKRSWRERKQELLPAGAGCLGILGGLVVNPYFPGNLVAGAQTLGIALNQGAMPMGLQLSMGGEMRPMGFSEFFFSLGMQAGLTFVTLFFLLRERKKIAPFQLALGLVCIAFWIASIKTRRALEFAVPVNALFAILFWQTRPQWGAFLLTGVFALQLPAFWTYVATTTKPGVYDLPSPALMEKLLEPVPNDKKVMVFHSNWGIGPYILYLRPKARVSEVLDPTFLWIYSPRRALLHRLLLEGRIGAPVRALKGDFSADYVICEPSPLCAQLTHHRLAKRESVSPDGYLSLYKILDSPWDANTGETADDGYTRQD